MNRDFLIEQACDLASKAHNGQLRKGTDMPYITHPMAVGIILAMSGATTDAVIAGILHDVVEDADITLDELENTFGRRVRLIIEACSEPDKSMPWKERKEHSLKDLKKADRDIWLTSLADKLNNIRSMLRDYETCGEELWDRFNQGKEEQEWYYRNLVEAFSINFKYRPCMIIEFKHLVNQLFD